MIGRGYTVSIGSQAQTAALTLIEITAPADAVVLIEKFWLGQTSIDAAQALGIKVEDVATTGTGTGTTPTPLNEGDAAFGGTVKTNMSAEPTYSGTVYIEDGFNILNGYKWEALNINDYIVVSPGQIIGFSLDVAPAASTDFSYGCKFYAVGG